ncbi:retrotransposon protein, putative, ty1-copia subclass [Tanacetum coccineum]|uniref:Retrotransposon protein, putative, ty1-copia subclass n=1 Tax=Tanacetum coccineum TaxID=301880 RepID=A0ABQ4ZT69_9ASTR
MWGRKKGTGGKGNEAKWERKGGGRGNRDGGWGKEREPGARGKEGLGEGRGGLGREEGGKREERGKEEGITGEGQGTGGEEEVGQWYWKGKVQEGSEGMEGKGSREEREGRGEGEGGGRRTGGGEYGRKVRRAEAALLDPESDKWLNAMNVEMKSMKDNEVWELVDLPPNGKTVGHKSLFKKKTDMDGAVHTYKACLVAKGFTQTLRIDYEETFSPVADIRAIRILIAIAAFYDYEIWQIDVKTAFLNGYLNEEVYMEQPEASGSYVTFLILYVDDILIMGNNILMLQDVKSYLGKCFAMKDIGEAAYILGIKIYQDRSKRLIGLCQSAYIKKILKRYYMENSKRGTIPMQEKLKFSKSQGASTPAEI